jgi:FMN phosphatase YigB (HAD superfamily)
MRFEAVIFDYVGVLVEMNRRQAAEFFQHRTRLPVATLTRRWEEWCSEHIGEVLSGLAMWQSFWTALAAEVGIGAQELAEIHAFDWFGMFTACPDALVALSDARRLGLRIGVLSNSVLPKLEAPSMPIALSELADVVRVPRRGSAVKPSRAAYVEMAAQLGAAPERCLYFDNELPFVEGARAAGMRGYLVDRKLGEGAAPAGVVKDLGGLAALIEESA